jgi:hypothetical protein
MKSICPCADCNPATGSGGLPVRYIHVQAAFDSNGNIVGFDLPAHMVGDDLRKVVAEMVRVLGTGPKTAKPAAPGKKIKWREFL